jgi:hypothetical protein
MKINKFVKPTVDFLINILGIGFLALLSIFYVKQALGEDRQDRIEDGILWLAIGSFFYLLSRIKPFMKWMYRIQMGRIKRKQTFEDFQKKYGKTVFYFPVYFALIDFIVAFFF